MAFYRLKLYRVYGENPRKRELVQDQHIEAKDDTEAIATAEAVGVSKWDDSDHAILWDTHGKDIKHWTPHA